MNDKKYIKLVDLVDGEFTVEKVFYPQFKFWDNDAKKMLISERWEKGYRKVYGVVTDKGTLDLSATQLGNMLESVSKGGEANIVNRSFAVKSNGKSGMDIRYYINAIKQEREEGENWKKAKEVFSPKNEEADMSGLTAEEISQIPF